MIVFKIHLSYFTFSWEWENHYNDLDKINFTILAPEDSSFYWQA